MADSQGRKYLLTINNPKEHGISHETIKAKLMQLKSMIYCCIADEIGLEGKTPHIHVFIALKSPARFSRIKKLFPEAHIDQCRGTCQENRDYIEKTGKWANDPKADTSVEGTFEEIGEMPEELGAGYRTDIGAVYSLIAEGKTNAEIMEENPDYAGRITMMDRIRQDILEERYRDTFRNMDVTYIWGETGTGKTRHVLETHGYKEVFRITDYSHPFDRYASEPVLCLDEFRSSLPIGDMLQYLDGYPMALPARYANRVACYETVYIISNIPLTAQYRNVQDYELSTWKAFLRRIHHVIEYTAAGTQINHGTATEFVFPVEGFQLDEQITF